MCVCVFTYLCVTGKKFYIYVDPYIDLVYMYLVFALTCLQRHTNLPMPGSHLSTSPKGMMNRWVGCEQEQLWIIIIDTNHYNTEASGHVQPHACVYIQICVQCYSKDTNPFTMSKMFITLWSRPYYHFHKS